MARILPYLFFPFIVMLLVTTSSLGQCWKLAKEKDGIHIYTSDEPNTNLKSFKGEADLKTTMHKLCACLGNLDNLNWWDDDIKQVDILHHERDKLIQYYIVYDSPWPVTDRDLCVQSHIIKNTAEGSMVVEAEPYAQGVPEVKDRVRIKDYWQRWTLQDLHNGSFHVTLEGFVDPGGNIPAWVYNMFITDTPFKVIRNLREEVVEQ